MSRASIPPADELPFKPGDEVDGYRILRVIGSGAMGVVYHAKDCLDQDFAIKCLRVQENISEEALNIEARILCRLREDHIVQIQTARRLSNGFFLLVMELLVGESLRERLSRGRLTPLETVRLGIGVARGLAYGHRLDITHRDIKPENIFLATGDRVKIVDYGVAKFRKPGRSSTLGRRYGTPKYAAPEQFISGHPMGPWSDLYSLCCVLYECKTGRHPYAKGPGHDGLPGSDAMGAVHALWQPQPMATLLPELAAYRDVEDIIVRGLAKHPADRWWREPRGLEFQEGQQDIVTWDFVASLEALLPRLEADAKRRAKPGQIDTEPMTQPPPLGGPGRATIVGVGGAVAGGASVGVGGAGAGSLLQRQPTNGTVPLPVLDWPLAKVATAPLPESASARAALPFARSFPFGDELRTGDADDDDAAAGWVRATREMTKAGGVIARDGLSASLRIHPHPAVRATCAEELGKVGDAGCLEDLRSQLGVEMHGVVAQQLVAAILAIEERGAAAPRDSAKGKGKTTAKGDARGVVSGKGAGRLSPVDARSAITDVTAEVRSGRGDGRTSRLPSGLAAPPVNGASRASGVSWAGTRGRSLLLGALIALPVTAMLVLGVRRLVGVPVAQGEPATAVSGAASVVTVPSVVMVPSVVVPSVAAVAPVVMAAPSVAVVPSVAVAPSVAVLPSVVPVVPAASVAKSPVKPGAAARPLPRSSKPAAAASAAPAVKPSAAATSILPFGKSED